MPLNQPFGELGERIRGVRIAVKFTRPRAGEREKNHRHEYAMISVARELRPAAVMKFSVNLEAVDESLLASYDADRNACLRKFGCHSIYAV